MQILLLKLNELVLMILHCAVIKSDSVSFFKFSLRNSAQVSLSLEVSVQLFFFLFFVLKAIQFLKFSLRNYAQVSLSLEVSVQLFFFLSFVIKSDSASFFQSSGPPHKFSWLYLQSATVALHVDTPPGMPSTKFT